MKNIVTIGVLMIGLVLSTLSSQAETQIQTVRHEHIHVGVPLVQVYEHTSHETSIPSNHDMISVGEGTVSTSTDERSVEILDVPLAHVLKAAQSPEEGAVSVVHVPFFTLAKTKRSGKYRSLKLVHTPLASVLRTDEYDNGDHDRRFLSLPFLGPVFRHKRDGSSTTTKFLFFKTTRHSKKGAKR